MTTIKQYKEEVKKGCGKDIIYKPFTYPIVCGDMELDELNNIPLHLILCQSCQAKLSAIEICEKIMNEKVEMLKNKLDNYQEDFANLDWVSKDHILEQIEIIFGENK